MINFPGAERKAVKASWPSHQGEFREGLVDDNEKCPVSGKQMYATEGEALASAAHQMATANAPKYLRAYLCSWCNAWHLTKNTGSPGKNRR
jgi:hypothetical protein